MRKVGRWTLGAELGRGGFSAVFRAQDERGQQAALKLFHGAALGPEPLARFARETQALARIEDEGLVRVLEAGQQDGQPWLALELIEGEDLERRLRTRGPLPAREALEIALQLARTLGRLHAAGVVHRDLKPANVMLRPDGRPVLLDLGLVLLLGADPRLTASGELMGTPGYLPPELARGETRKMGPASDVYGLGATLWALLVGRPPFEADSALATVSRVLSDPPALPSAGRAGLSPAIDRVVLRCLAKRPEERFPSAEALTFELERLLAPARAPARSVAATAVAVGLVALGLGAGAGVAALGPRRSPAAAAASPGTAANTTAVPAETIEALLARARGAIATNHRAGALDLALQAVELAPDSAEALIVLSEALVEVGRVDDAIAKLDAAVKLAPGDASTWAARCSLHHRRRRRPGEEPHEKRRLAQEDAVRALALDPDCAIAVAVRALGSPDEGGRVRRELDRAVELGPNEPWVHVWRAMHRLASDRDVDGAYQDFSRAVELERDRACWRSVRASYMQRHAHRIAGAVEDAREAVELDPGDPGNWGTCGRVLIHAGRYREAFQALDRAIALAGDVPGAAPYYFDRGIARWALKDVEGGIADETKALELDPMPAALAFRGRMHLEKGDMVRARADYDACVGDRVPREWAEIELACGLSGKYLELERPGEAKLLLDKLLQGDPRRARALALRALAHLALEDATRAREDVKALLEVEPDHPQRAALQGRLAELERR